MRLACRRIKDNWTTIEAALFPGDSLVALSSITTTGNDFHKGGKQVLILGFELANAIKSGLVVYKPSSVEIDCRIVGNTKIVNTYKPQGYTQTASLSELINKHNPARPRPEGFTSSELPTYTILPYNRGSVTDGYGYIQYLTRLPRVEGPFTAHSDMLDKPARKVASLSPDDVDRSDWVVSGPSAGQVFYHQLGVLMAMAQAVSLCDLHVQNMIVHAKSPHLIDLEEALKHPMTKIEETYLTGLVDRPYDPESPVMNVRDDKNTPYPIIGWVKPVGRPAASVLFRSHGLGSLGEPVVLAGDAKSDGERNRQALVRGVIDCVEALATDVCNSDVQTWATGLKGVLARFVPVGTETYAQAGRGF